MQFQFSFHQEGLPDYWGIETLYACVYLFVLVDQEGLPDYWGIETVVVGIPNENNVPDQEGLPDYWGIETM